jgi:PKD repeat protein
MRKLFATSIAIAAAVLAGSCTVHETEVPGLAGPSELALSLRIRAVPDSITQDGASQSAITVTANGPNGEALVGLAVRLDMAVGGVIQDFGTLAARTVVTGTSGSATTTYTAPPAPIGGGAGLGNEVTIVAIPTGSDFQAANGQQVVIRLVPPGVILPPAGSPTASFSVSPTPVTVGTAAIFDGTASTPGSGASQIVSYSWNFGDGTGGSGASVQHTFGAAGTYNVTLTVRNDRGISASTTQAIPATASAAPTARITFSPAAVVGGATTVNFSGTTSTAAPGRSIVAYAWDFGDGATGTGATVTHVFPVVNAATTFKVTLTVTDDLGLTGSATADVNVTGNSPTAAFTFSPTPIKGEGATGKVSCTAGGTTVYFNASTSTPAAGRTITAYSWAWGDGGSTNVAVATTTHCFPAVTAATTFKVTLTVTDDVGRTGSVTQDVAVTP